MLVAAPIPAEAATSTRTSFVVNTQFWDDPSPIVASSGPLSSCSSVRNLDGREEQTGPRTVLFSGTKELICDGGSVTVSYEARINLSAGRKTSGTWSVIASTLPGVTYGGGQVKGDNARCEPLPGSEGCILDRFSGRVGG